MTIVIARPSEAQMRKEIRIMNRAGERLSKSPEAARAFLLKYGFITKDNKLHKQYR
jgi:hypothetical protein